MMNTDRQALTSPGASSSHGQNPLCITDLKRGRIATAVVLLLCRIWNAIMPDKTEAQSNLECVGIDAKGDAIHIVIDQKLAPAYREKLVEGRIYRFKQILPVIARKFRVVRREDKLKVLQTTEVEEENDNSQVIKKHYFEFNSFPELSKRLNADIMLTDLIGVLIKIEDPANGYSDQIEKLRSKFYLQDFSGNEFPVQLWGVHSQRFRQLNLEDADQTTIIVVCSLAIREHYGQIHGNSLSATRFYVNLDIPEVKEYLDKFGSSPVSPGIVDSRPKKQEAPANRTIAQLLGGLGAEVEFDKRYHCIATVDGFEIDDGFYYTACKKCHCALEKLSDVSEPIERWGCKKCNSTEAAAVPWYKFKVSVRDCTGSTMFTVFGHQGDKLIGTSVKQLATNRDIDRQCIPPVMDQVVGKTKLFEIAVTEHKRHRGEPQLILQNIYELDEASKLQSSMSTGVTNFSPSSSGSSITPKYGGKRSIHTIDVGHCDSSTPCTKKQQTLSDDDTPITFTKEQLRSFLRSAMEGVTPLASIKECDEFATKDAIDQSANQKQIMAGKNLFQEAFEDVLATSSFVPQNKSVEIPTKQDSSIPDCEEDDDIPLSALVPPRKDMRKKTDLTKIEVVDAKNESSSDLVAPATLIDVGDKSTIMMGKQNQNCDDKPAQLLLAQATSSVVDDGSSLPTAKPTKSSGRGRKEKKKRGH